MCRSQFVDTHHFPTAVVINIVNPFEDSRLSQKLYTIAAWFRTFGTTISVYPSNIQVKLPRLLISALFQTLGFDVVDVISKTLEEKGKRRLQSEYSCN
jgi:hypothetical protein